MLVRLTGRPLNDPDLRYVGEVKNGQLRRVFVSKARCAVDRLPAWPCHVEDLPVDEPVGISGDRR